MLTCGTEMAAQAAFLLFAFAFEPVSGDRGAERGAGAEQESEPEVPRVSDSVA